MTRAAFTLAALTALVVLPACSASSGSSTPRPNRDLIAHEEITELSVATAYEVIERLRPHFLRAARGGGTPNVYINGSRSGGIAILRSIRADAIQDIRYLSAVDANLRYGVGNDSGVIEVQLLR
ncbi:MAG TPA: hypothetical protein VMN60_06415 [Longimicrobiales bacterium]|nr:hypothetical protein [Longimicrobiales bacterium]